MTHRPVIAIVGGGFSGTMLAVQLIRQATAPLEILWFDGDAAFAKGVAYGTHDLLHLLNVPAARMSAFPDAPTHLIDWLRGHEPDWKAKLPGLANAHYDEGSFIPRALYGIYLQWLCAEGQMQAEEKHLSFQLHPKRVAEAENISKGWQLTTEDGLRHTADMLVLATGNPPARDFPVEGTVGLVRYIAHVWSDAGKAFLETTPVDALEHPVAVIGTGLTMVDVALSLTARGLNQPLIALSRHAALPMPHAPAALPWTLTSDFMQPSLVARFRLLRKEMRVANEQGVSWHAVFDALRPQTIALWQSMSLKLQRRFLKKWWSVWNIHRHRMPPSSHATLQMLAARNLLRFHHAHVTQIDAKNPDRLVIHWKGKDGVPSHCAASYVLNCTGPEMRLEGISNPLLQQLAVKGIIRSHPTGVGADMVDGSALAGNAEGKIFAIGPLRLGNLLETTAVPELRQQAQQLAAYLLEKGMPC